MELVNAQIDVAVDKQLIPLVPERYRGERKLSMRVEYALREFIESQGNGSGVAGRSAGTNVNDPADRPVKSS